MTKAMRARIAKTAKKVTMVKKQMKNGKCVSVYAAQCVVNYRAASNIFQHSKLHYSNFKTGLPKIMECGLSLCAYSPWAQVWWTVPEEISGLPQKIRDERVQISPTLCEGVCMDQGMVGVE